jgi:hypothetical protein
VCWPSAGASATAAPTGERKRPAGRLRARCYGRTGRRDGAPASPCAACIVLHSLAHWFRDGIMGLFTYVSGGPAGPIAGVQLGPTFGSKRREGSTNSGSSYRQQQALAAPAM